LVFTTPDVLRGASEPTWIAHLERALGAAKGDANKSVAVSKHGVDSSEYVFAGYAAHGTEAISREGLPDVTASLPHDSPRTR
jgi:hypothetical protein